MKKMLAGLAVVFLLLLVAGFFLIPSQPVVRKMITVAGPQPAVFRAFTDPMLLQQWLSSGSGKISTSNDTLVYTDGKLRMLISPGMLHVAQVIISKNEKAYNSTVNIIAVSQSESAIEWKAVFPLASNPVSRLRNYFAAKQTAN